MTEIRTVLKQILDAMDTAIAAVPGVSEVTRSRTTPAARDEGAVVNMMWSEAQPDIKTPAFIEWNFSVKFEIIMRAAVPDSAADPIWSALHKAISTDLSLGGLTQDIQPSRVGNEAFDADGGAGIVSPEYLIIFRTSRADLTINGA